MAPLFASSHAVCLPIPEFAPVTIITFPSTFDVSCPSYNLPPNCSLKKKIVGYKPNSEEINTLHHVFKKNGKSETLHSKV